MKLKIKFSVWLSLGITLFVLIIFTVASLIFQQALYQILVEQAAKDNRVIGESILALLEENHSETQTLDTLITSVQKSCDILKLPNGGYICATTSDGSLVAYPEMKPSERGKDNVKGAAFTDLKTGDAEDFSTFDSDSVFTGYYEYKESNYSDIIVKLKHKSGLNIMVHQDNNSIMQKSKDEGYKLLYFGFFSSILIGVVLYFFINSQVNKYQSTIKLQGKKILEASHEIKLSHENIIASINYAQRIQKAILPLQEEINEAIPENFILFKPKDIVSGDFYYLNKKDDKVILAAVDCTGHGVPGAFMSMIGNDMLNEIIEHKSISDADDILNELHKNIRFLLKQNETQTNDGMDISLIVIDKVNRTFDFAGAKNPIIYIQNNELFHIKGDKSPIGGEQRELERKFTKHKVELNNCAKNDNQNESSAMIYLFSDGYQDQFGGVENKKFMVANLKKLFFEIHQKPMQEQKQILEKELSSWMSNGRQKQIDDILIIGIKI